MSFNINALGKNKASQRGFLMTSLLVWDKDKNPVLEGITPDILNKLLTLKLLKQVAKKLKLAHNKSKAELVVLVAQKINVETVLSQPNQVKSNGEEKR